MQTCSCCGSLLVIFKANRLGSTSFILYLIADPNGKYCCLHFQNTFLQVGTEKVWGLCCAMVFIFSGSSAFSSCVGTCATSDSTVCYGKPCHIGSSFLAFPLG